MNNRRILYIAAFCRALLVGMLGVLLALHLAHLQFSPAEIGFVVGAGLGGAALAALVASFFADRLGRRLFLVGLSLLMSVGGAVVALSSDVGWILVASFFGMLNGMGRDRGAALVIEQAILPATTNDSERTKTFAFYSVLQDAGHAFGGLLAGLPTLLRGVYDISEDVSVRVVLLGYSVVFLGMAVLYTRLSSSIEIGQPKQERISAQSRSVLTKISALFALDALGGGFLVTALIAYFFYERFGASEWVVGVLFFGARVLNAFSHLAAAWLAQRIGLLRTMVFTHIPSSLLLVTVAFAPNFTVAILLFLLREGLVEMDVPTRQSYVMAVVRPEERIFVSGVTQLVRLASWAIAPFFAGLFMQGLSLATPILIGATMKITYDILLFFAFRGLKPPEEK